MIFWQRLARYQPVLWLLAGLGLLGLNGVFVYYALLRPDVVEAALRNPVSLVFVVEAFVMVAFAAWVITRIGLRRPGWFVFVVLSIVGGLAFSVPFFLLLHLRKGDPPPEDGGHPHPAP